MKEKKIKEETKENEEDNEISIKKPTLNLEKKGSIESCEGGNEKAKELIQRFFQKRVLHTANTAGSMNINSNLERNQVGIEIEKIEAKPSEFEQDSDDEEEESQKILESKEILFSFFFPKKERIAEFYQDLEKNTNFNFRMTLLLYSLVYFVHALILIRIKDFYDKYDGLVGLRIISAASIAAFQIFKKNLYTNNLLKLALFIVMLFSFWISFYQGYSYNPNLHFLQTFQLIEMSLSFTVVLYFP